MIKRAKEALEGATPGPWAIGIDSDVYPEGECDTWMTLGPKNYDAVVLVVNEHFKADAEVGLNARLIALAPDLARALIAAGELADAHDANRPIEDIDQALVAFRATLQEKTDDQ